MNSGLAHKVVTLMLIGTVISWCCVCPVSRAQSPVLEVDVTELDFGETETSMTFTITNAGEGTLTWSLSEDDEWISVAPTSGSLEADISETVAVTLDRTKVLTGGEITSTIAITSNDGDAEVTVSMISTIPILTVDVTTLDFGETESNKTFTITNAGGDTLAWSLSEDDEWMTVDVTSGSLEADMSETVTVEVDRSGLFPIGVVNGTITVDGGDTTATVAVTMMPLRTVGPASFDFGSEDMVKELFINNRGSGSLAWSITTQEVWLSVDTESGTTDEGILDVIQVIVDRSTVADLGDYTDTLQITSDAGDISLAVAMEKRHPPPDIPTSVAPVDGATNQSLTTTLSCQGGDADSGEGDSVTYTIYLSSDEMLVDSEDSSVLMCSDMKTCYCDPGTVSLENSSTYYWKAVAQDTYDGITSSEVWSFTTEGPANGLCPAFALGLQDEDFRLLRRLRDEILSEDEQGRIYIDAYYRHGWELFLILLTSYELRIEAGEIVEGLLPVSQSLLTEREALMSQALHGKVTTFLGKVSEYAHPQLKKVLITTQDHLQKRGAFERFGISIPGN